MTRVLLPLMAMTLAVLCSLQVTAQQGRRSNQSAASFGWSSNYQESLATARRTDKPLMIVFRCIP